MTDFSDYVVYVDESGDHSLAKINPEYPIFVLAFCVFTKDVYAGEVMPAVTQFKFRYFGHDQVILHEHTIRKARDDFRFLIDSKRRAAFYPDLHSLVEDAAFTLIASVIDKHQHVKVYSDPASPYDLALQFCLERLAMHLNGLGSTGTTHIVFERRGENEDKELELVFRRACDGGNLLGERLPFEIIFASKKVNSSGLQFADLVARPIGLRTLRPDQPNRAYEVLEGKLRKNPQTGNPSGWGLKVSLKSRKAPVFTETQRRSGFPNPFEYGSCFGRPAMSSFTETQRRSGFPNEERGESWLSVH